MHTLLPDSTFRSWEQILLRSVIWHKATPTWRNHTNDYITDSEYYCCLSMYVPSVKYETYGWNEAFHKTSWYQAAGWSTTGW